MSMIEHGIMTTSADYWVHLFPLEHSVYWYRVTHMRDFIKRRNLPATIIGKSKDGAATGGGYLVARDSYFVRYAGVDDHYLDHLNWRAMTDRECGFAGEEIVDVLIEHRIVQLPFMRAQKLRSQSDQFSGADFVAEYFVKARIETKTERTENTRNLFVQTKEGGHRVHLASQNGVVTERVTDAPGFSDSWEPF